MRELCKNIITFHWLLTLLIMCASVFVFSISSFNIYFLLKANLGFILEHGMMAIKDGGLMQFAELIAHSLVSAAFYVVFKVCEKVLVEKFLD